MHVLCYVFWKKKWVQEEKLWQTIRSACMLILVLAQHLKLQANTTSSSPRYGINFTNAHTLDHMKKIDTVAWQFWHSKLPACMMGMLEAGYTATEQARSTDNLETCLSSPLSTIATRTTHLDKSQTFRLPMESLLYQCLVSSLEQHLLLQSLFSFIMPMCKVHVARFFTTEPNFKPFPFLHSK